MRKGPAGYGSMPLQEAAVTRLIRALEKIRQFDAEVKVIPAVQAYVAALAKREEPTKAERYHNLERALADPGFLQEFTSNPTDNALVRNTNFTNRARRK